MVYTYEYDQVLERKTITKNQNEIVIKSFHCWPIKLAISGDVQAAVNTAIAFSVRYIDWQDNPLLNENRPIHITALGPGQSQELVLTPADGQAEFDFVSAVAGIFKIRATAEFPCDSAEIEVVVS